MNHPTSWSYFGRRLSVASALAASLALGCALESEQPSPGAGGTAATAGTGGATGGGAGSATTGGSAGSAGATSGAAGGGAGGSSAGMTGSGGAGSGGAGAGGEMTAGAAGSAGISGSAGASGSAGDGAGGAGAAGAAGSAGDGAGMSGAGGAAAGSAGSAGSGGAGGAAAGASGASGSAGASGAGGAAAYQPCPASGPCIILPFGDSITDGFGTPGGYRMELFRLARADGHEITYVGSLQNGPTQYDGVPFPRRHEGHSGWRINQLLELIPAPGFDTIPHIVLLMIGTNDVINNDNLGQAPTRLGNLLDEIIMTAPDALIVLAKITPMDRSDTQINAYNNGMLNLVGQRVAAGKHILLVDMYTGFPMNELADGIHPNPAGYTRMAGVWYQAIEPFLR